MSGKDSEKRTNDDSGSKDESEWGFKSGRSGMATETKIGFLLILVLLGAFGFVIYKKMDKHGEHTAKTISPDDHHHGDDKMFGGQGSVDDAFTEDRDHKHAGHASVNDDRRDPLGSDPFANDGHKHDDRQHKKEAPAPPPPTERTVGARAADSANPFTADAPPPKMKDAPKPQGRPVADNVSPFNDLPAQSEPKAKKLEQKTAQKDEFGSPLETGWAQDMGPGKTAAANAAQVKVTPKPMAPAPAPKRLEDGFDPTVGGKKGQTFAEDKPSPDDDMKLFENEVKPRSNGTKLKPASDTHAHAGGLDDGMTGSADWNEPAQAPPPKNRQTSKPNVVADDPFNKGNRFREDPEAPKPRGNGNGRDQHGGDSSHHHHDVEDGQLDAEPAAVYIVESGDNYWSISRKQYGSARYFTALARFNERRIPDPRAMRPGMKVLVPDPQRLAAMFPHLVGQKSQVVQASGEDNCAPGSVQPAGFFVAQDGQPMYRIGKQDTLTEIAQRHLGRSSRWIQVFKLNQDRLKTPNDLKIGTELVLPADASQVRMVSEPLEYR